MDGRLRKSVFDWTSDLLPMLRDSEDRAIESSASYTMLRRLVERRAREEGGPDVVAFQFVIALHSGFDESTEPDVLFVSRRHHV